MSIGSEVSLPVEDGGLEGAAAISPISELVGRDRKGRGLEDGGAAAIQPIFEAATGRGSRGGRGGRGTPGRGRGRNIGEKRSRARNWELVETVTLVTAKRIEWEKYEKSTATEKARSSTNEKWENVGKFLHDHGFLHRDGKQCRYKWENLLSEYKAVKDWDKRSGVRPYSEMDVESRVAEGLPKQFTSELYKLMESMYSNRLLIHSPRIYDSSVPVPGSQNDNDQNEHDEDLTDLSSPKQPSTQPMQPMQPMQTMQPSTQQTTGEAGSSGRKRKPSQVLGIETALRESNSNFSLVSERQRVEIEELDKEKIALDREKIALDRERIAMEREKIAMEREKVEGEKIDRRVIISVLRDMATVFDKIADKL